MVAFIDEHRKAYGVEPICRVRLASRTRLADEEPLNRHRLRKPDLLQLVHGTPRRRHRQDGPPRLGQSPVELVQGGRLARAGSAAQTDRAVARREHLVHRVLLVRPQPIGRQEGVVAAQPIEGADPRLMTAIICRSRSRLSRVATSCPTHRIAPEDSSSPSTPLASASAIRPRPCRSVSARTSCSWTTDRRSNRCCSAYRSAGATRTSELGFDETGQPPKIRQRTANCEIIECRFWPRHYLKV
jgi:hypothetical protein